MQKLLNTSAPASPCDDLKALCVCDMTTYCEIMFEKIITQILREINPCAWGLCQSTKVAWFYASCEGVVGMNPRPKFRNPNKIKFGRL